MLRMGATSREGAPIFKACGAIQRYFAAPQALQTMASTRLGELNTTP